MATHRKTEGGAPTPSSTRLNDELKTRNRNRRESLRSLSMAQTSGGVRRNDLLPPLEVVYLGLDELKLAPRRLRKRQPAHVREVAEAIKEFGFSSPILIGKDNVIINGEIALEAARLLGLDRVPCVRAGHLSEPQQRLLRLAVNRLAEKGEWDVAALKIEFEDLVLHDAPIEISGFAPEEIDQILTLGSEGDGVEEGPLAPEPDVIPVARPGDMFRLGPHSVVCGDATDAAVLRRLMSADAEARQRPGAAAIGRDRAVAQIVLTDEPYNVRIAGNVTGGDHREFAMASGEMTPLQYLAFNEAWMSAALPYLANGGVLATFIDWRGYPTIDAAAINLGLVPLNLVVWTKTNAGMGSLYRSHHELLPLYRKGDAPHVNNVALGKRGRWRSNVWTYPGASSRGSDARRGLKEHPTVKPTAMLEDALLDLTRRGDIVLDPFLGSGSTLVAAHRAGRVCHGLEIDPLYVDLILRRFEAETGEAPVLAETGETYLELAARRTQAAERQTSSPDASADGKGRRTRRGRERA